MEELFVQRFHTKLHKRFYAPQVIRYADDLVVLHKDRAIIEQCQEVLAEWLLNIGLELKPSKTRIAQTKQEFYKETHPPTRSNRWPTSTQRADAANQGAELVDYRLE